MKAVGRELMTKGWEVCRLSAILDIEREFTRKKEGEERKERERMGGEEEDERMEVEEEDPTTERTRTTQSTNEEANRAFRITQPGTTTTTSSQTNALSSLSTNHAANTAFIIQDPTPPATNANAVPMGSRHRDTDTVTHGALREAMQQSEARIVNQIGRILNARLGGNPTPQARTTTTRAQGTTQDRTRPQQPQQQQQPQHPQQERRGREDSGEFPPLGTNVSYSKAATRRMPKPTTTTTTDKTTKEGTSTTPTPITTPTGTPSPNNTPPSTSPRQQKKTEATTKLVLGISRVNTNTMKKESTTQRGQRIRQWMSTNRTLKDDVLLNNYRNKTGNLVLEFKTRAKLRDDLLQAGPSVMNCVVGHAIAQDPDFEYWIAAPRLYYIIQYAPTRDPETQGTYTTQEIEADLKANAVFKNIQFATPPDYTSPNARTDPNMKRCPIGVCFDDPTGNIREKIEATKRIFALGTSLTIAHRKPLPKWKLCVRCACPGHLDYGCSKQPKCVKCGGNHRLANHENHCAQCKQEGRTTSEECNHVDTWRCNLCSARGHETGSPECPERKKFATPKPAAESESRMDTSMINV